MKKKIVSLVLVFALALALGIGGTVAWLTAQTTEVVNTFTVGDINLTLAESVANAFDIVPGDVKAKDPTVTVAANSENCYVFVKITEANNARADLDGKIVSWAVDTSIWTAVPGHEGYWYKEVDKSDSATPLTVFTDSIAADGKNGSVSINENITKEMVPTINNNKPTITVVAAAVQKDNVGDVASAWAKLPTTFTGAANS